MLPAPGDRLLRFVGDQIVVTVSIPPELGRVERVMLRTTLGKAEAYRQEIIKTYAGTKPLSLQFWRDVEMEQSGTREWKIALLLHEVGFFLAKAYFLNSQNDQVWPDGDDLGVSVHPNEYRTGNTIYCAFTRMFGATKEMAQTKSPSEELEFKAWDQKGYTLIPPSGKLRDLTRELSHIVRHLGCKILHLLPVNPTPTTMARFGRFGSPYACQDLTAIDPALVEFDKRTTGVEQFLELTFEAHRRGARVFLDIVINHTGWGSKLFEEHPEWFLRQRDGAFASPGAWGTIWEDLVELDPEYRALWDELAVAFLVWCRRGVDGFRCDAGYKVPVPVWQYIIARVRQEFPNTLFLLEGLGGSWHATEKLLTTGMMQWAYSELFQNYSPQQVSGYLDYALAQGHRVGVYVHYSETHDNDRLAKRGKLWSLLRNQLCALTSVSGGYGFTCGVEWLADEKIEVHQNRGMRWGDPQNIVSELRTLNDLLQQHPCFFDGAKLTRVSETASQIYALHRESWDSKDHLLILANLDVEGEQMVSLSRKSFDPMGSPTLDLLSGRNVEWTETEDRVELKLQPGQCCCLGAGAEPKGLAGDDYRLLRAQAAWGLGALAKRFRSELLGNLDWKAVALQVQDDPFGFLVGVANLPAPTPAGNFWTAWKEASKGFPKVVIWTLLDRKRIVLVPSEHWILIQDPRPFHAVLRLSGSPLPLCVESIPVWGSHVACIPPQDLTGTIAGNLRMERYGLANPQVEGQFLFLRPVRSEIFSKPFLPGKDSLVLLTNGRGAMARLRVDFGQIYSKYDCALGANLAPDMPVDRHVFVKRLRIWVNADGFIRPLDGGTISNFEPGPPARWKFLVTAGENSQATLMVTADMIEQENTTLFRVTRLADPGILNPVKSLGLAVRVDIEDRNFHTETMRHHGVENYFSSNIRILEDQIGFNFDPAADRHLKVFCTKGTFHPAPEWTGDISHPIEVSRGQTGHGTAYSPGWFDVSLDRMESAVVVLNAETSPVSEDHLHQFETYREIAVRRAMARAGFHSDDEFGQQLAVAAQAYVVQRGAGKTVVAGYPWFLDWGRDSLICARGLLAAGLVQEVQALLLTFARFVEHGTMPNTIHGADASNRDTSDASLWFGVVCEELAEFNPEIFGTAVNASGKTISEVLLEIAHGYFLGTPNGIYCDQASGLIWSPKHFSWMDTNYPAGTPREGYPIEIQALWIRLLKLLRKIGAPPLKVGWGEIISRAEKSIEQLFWISDREYIGDLIVAPKGVAAADGRQDNSLRSNACFAVSLGIVTGHRARKTVEATLRHLVIPGALRTLAPLPVSPPLPIYGGDGSLLNNPIEPYFGRYEGDEDTRRKPAYHNGTAWTWTFPSFCEALAAAWDFEPVAVRSARAYLSSSQLLLTTGCIGQIPEILDGDAPHQERGCDAQAWGVTEALRVWKLLDSVRKQT